MYFSDFFMQFGNDIFISQGTNNLQLLGLKLIKQKPVI